MPEFKIKPEFIVNLKGKQMHHESALVAEPFDRLMRGVRFAENGCWEWIGQRFKCGYGKLRFGQRSPTSYAHIWAYRMHYGPVPPGLELDHLCRNRACVNPDHLEPVTHRENSRRGLCGHLTGAKNRAKTHCRNGHEFSGENLYVYPDGERGCRQCNRDAQRRYGERKKRNAAQA